MDTLFAEDIILETGTEEMEELTGSAGTENEQQEGMETEPVESEKEKETPPTNDNQVSADGGG